MDIETFVFLRWAWDIDIATRLAARHRPQRTDIRPLAWARALIRIDTDHAATVDLSRPLLTVPIPNTDTPLVIDGWHRIHRALTTGIHELQVVHLDTGDERACRITGGGR